MILTTECFSKLLLFFFYIETYVVTNFKKNSKRLYVYIYEYEDG